MKKYGEILIPYLNRRCDRTAIVLEKGSSEEYTHYQCVVDFPANSESIRQFLKPKFEKLPGYHPDYTFKMLKQDHVGDAMFGYVMKEENKLVCDRKGISEEEMQRFAEEFAKLPDFKEAKRKRKAEDETHEKKERKRRQSFKHVEECARYLWDFLPLRDITQEVYLEKPKYRRVWKPAHNREFTYIHKDKRFDASKDSAYDSKYVCVEKKGKEFVQGRWEEEQIDWEEQVVGQVRDVDKCTRKWAKALLIQRGVELQDTTYANTYMKHFDSIKCLMKNWENLLEENILKSDVYESSSDDSESTDCSFSIEQSVTNSTTNQSGGTE